LIDEQLKEAERSGWRVVGREVEWLTGEGVTGQKGRRIQAWWDTPSTIRRRRWRFVFSCSWWRLLFLLLLF
jgi:hypothetical protein